MPALSALIVIGCALLALWVALRDPLQIGTTGSVAIWGACLVGTIIVGSLVRLATSSA